MPDIYIYIIFFLAAFLLSLYLHFFFFRRSKKYTIRKANITGLRWGSQTKPVSGGITFFAAYIIGSIAYMLIMGHDNMLNNQIIGFSIIIILSFLMGLADDIVNTSPYFKFFVQILSGFILINFDIYIQLFANDYLNYALTIFWIVGIMNSINMLDNMDGVTTLVSITIIGGLLFNIFMKESGNDMPFIIICICILAALIGFLFFNWYPSKMYMGDNGSQFIGSVLATFSIPYLWNYHPGVADSAGFFNVILIIALTFLIPLTDTFSVTVNRILKGKSPFIGGRDHTTHHMYYLGFSERKIGLIYLLLSFVSVAFSLILLHYSQSAAIKAIFISYAVIIFLLLYINTKITKKKEGPDEKK